MDFYPLNLILAIAVASATVFLGFLPTRNIRSEFFTRQILFAVFAWAFIGVVSPSVISQYHCIIAFLCFASWWQFRRDRALGGKMWLSIASGLGISIGVMLILAVTPRAYPPTLPQPGQDLLLASIYLGGAVIGLAYVCHVMVQALSTTSGITQEQVRRYVGLLTALVFVRAGVLLILTFASAPISGPTRPYGLPETQPSFQLFGHAFEVGAMGYVLKRSFSFQTIFLLVLVVFILPVLVLAARRVFRSHSSAQAGFILISICLVGILAEILARLLVL